MGQQHVEALDQLAIALHHLALEYPVQQQLRIEAHVQRLAGILHAHIHYARIEDILKQGLHEYLTDFMDRIYELGEGISKDFLVPA